MYVSRLLIAVMINTFAASVNLQKDANEMKKKMMWNDQNSGTCIPIYAK